MPSQLYSSSIEVASSPTVVSNTPKLRPRSSAKQVISSPVYDTYDEMQPKVQKRIRLTRNGSSNNSTQPKPTAKVLIPRPTRFKYRLLDEESDYIGISLLLIVFLITIFAYPHTAAGEEPKVSLQSVFYHGWITAVATGLGALPFSIISEPNKYWMGISNAVAGGMMLAASYSLIGEGMEYTNEEFGILNWAMPNLDINLHSTLRTWFGVALGIFFILGIKQVLDKYEDVKLIDISHLSGVSQHSAQKMFLIIIVMTLHSLSEGIGIGVSFGGKSGMKLGQFISMSLAVHNIPEGLAVGLVMTARKVSTLRIVLWAIFTSIPQPIFAIPAYLFVERFAPVLPSGLGFAAGAMSYVAIMELLLEAIEDTKNMQVTAITGIAAFAVMMMVQESLHHVVA